ncbi:type II toxin-antitoxin system VapC family toxin [Spirochaeta lutea]|uniref:Twitching motility protein PilT n=1 Tax=Spirochaeta lutea TaxID=1480694 RepID=A0A098QWR7_9SPIO|nr:PIN domain nuclease [Spirochaeta lutea]KGE72174.1 twitching motility protein PilT [Spirochaeta lutea]
MILVDTSVLIDYLKGLNNHATQAFDSIIDLGIPYGINEYIYQEVLQGVRTVGEFQLVKDYFEPLPFYSLRYGKESYEKAAFLGFSCRRSGVTVRSTIDLLIAQTAIENNLSLLHNDRDFENIAKVVPELTCYPPKP